MEARNLAPRDSIGRDDIIKAVRARHHRLSGDRKKGFNDGHAGHVMYAGVDGGGGRGKGGNGGKGKCGKQGKHGRSGRGKNEDGGGSAAAADGDGSSAKAAEGCTSVGECHRCGNKGHWNSTDKLCSRCNGRGHVDDICSSSIEEAVR